MLVDEIHIHLVAGTGGRGSVAFADKFLAVGPTGSEGGKGGSIYFESERDIGLLSYFASKKKIAAKNGENGGHHVRGATAEDTILKVPVGTTITNLDSGEVVTLNEPGERVLAVAGGEGGAGNYDFRSSRNTSPHEFEFGKPGQSADFKLELRLIADVGLIGLPNAGKSSLLNELTAAKSKVGSYAFTTLEPNLGSYYGLIIADIPGLIEGASEGKGLGFKFLKHIERTKTLFHLVAADSEDPVNDYKTVRAELKKFNPELCEKDEFVFLSRCDEATPKQLKDAIAKFAKLDIVPESISVLDSDSIDRVRAALNSLKDRK